jgi:hypothetical protein
LVAESRYSRVNAKRREFRLSAFSLLPPFWQGLALSAGRGESSRSGEKEPPTAKGCVRHPGIRRSNSRCLWLATPDGLTADFGSGARGERVRKSTRAVGALRTAFGNGSPRDAAHTSGFTTSKRAGPAGRRTVVPARVWAKRPSAETRLIAENTIAPNCGFPARALRNSRFSNSFEIARDSMSSLWTRFRFQR